MRAESGQPGERQFTEASINSIILFDFGHESLPIDLFLSPFLFRFTVVVESKVIVEVTAI